MSYPTNPPWVPSCASTGAGVEVPDATATRRTRAVQNECAKLGADYGKWYGYVCAELEKMERELTAAKAQLRERTQWQCKCGGTDCAGQAENERLRAEVEAFKANNRYMRGHTAGYAEARDEYGEQLKPLFAKVRELEADKARLADHAEEILGCYLLEKQIQGHPCPQNMVRCAQLQAAIDDARAGKGAP